MLKSVDRLSPADSGRGERYIRSLSSRFAWLVAGLLTLAAMAPRAMARPHWTLVNPGFGEPGGMFLPANVFFTDVRHGVLVGRVPVPRKGVKPGIVWTADGGSVWHRAKIKAAVKNTNLSGLWFSSAHVGWAVGTMPGGGPGRCVLLKTTNGGRTWRPIALPKFITSLSHVWFGPHGRHGRLMPSGGRVFWQTSDGGKTFTAVNVGQLFQGGWWIGSWRHLVLGGPAGSVLLSTDAGRKWIMVRTGLTGPAARLTAISFAKGGQVGWAVGGQGKWAINGGYWMPLKPVILHTVNGGKTWIRQPTPRGRSGALTTVWAISAKQAWAGSLLGYAYSYPPGFPPWLLHTANGGGTWPDVLHHFVSIHKLFFVDARHGWAIAGQPGSPDEPNGVVLVYGGR